MHDMRLYIISVTVLFGIQWSNVSSIKSLVSFGQSVSFIEIVASNGLMYS